MQVGLSADDIEPMDDVVKKLILDWAVEVRQCIRTIFTKFAVFQLSCLTDRLTASN